MADRLNWIFPKWQTAQVDIFPSYLFPSLNLVTHQFGGKCYLIFKLIIMYYELICHDQRTCDGRGFSNEIGILASIDLIFYLLMFISILLLLLNHATWKPFNYTTSTRISNALHFYCKQLWSTQDSVDLFRDEVNRRKLL